MSDVAQSSYSSTIYLASTYKACTYDMKIEKSTFGVIFQLNDDFFLDGIFSYILLKSWRNSDTCVRSTLEKWINTNLLWLLIMQNTCFVTTYNVDSTNSYSNLCTNFYADDILKKLLGDFFDISSRGFVPTHHYHIVIISM